MLSLTEQAWPSILLVRCSQRDEESTLVHGNADVHNVIIGALVDIYFSTMPNKLAEYSQFESNIRGLES